MDATDLDLARALLIANRDATLVAVRGDEIHVCHERGVKPLLKMIKEGRSLRGFAVADKVVGKAPALLYAVLGPEAVFSPRHVLDRARRSSRLWHRHELRHARPPHPEQGQDRPVPHGLLRHQRLGALRGRGAS